MLHIPHLPHNVLQTPLDFELLFWGTYREAYLRLVYGTTNVPCGAEIRMRFLKEEHAETLDPS